MKATLGLVPCVKVPGDGAQWVQSVPPASFLSNNLTVSKIELNEKLPQHNFPWTGPLNAHGHSGITDLRDVTEGG